MIGIMVDFKISFSRTARMIYVIQILDSKPSDRGPSDLGTWNLFGFKLSQVKSWAS